MKGRLLDPARASRVRLERSKRQEKRTAKQMGGKITPGSGNQWHAKGDVVTKQWMVENKRTEANSFVLKLDVLKKLLLQASLSNRQPVLQLDFGDSRVGKFAIIPLELFEELRDADST